MESSHFVRILIFIFSLTLYTLYPILHTPVFAHVVVKPAEVGVGQRINFTVSVPTEEAAPTIGLRLIIPEGLKSVRPNVKTGWTINLTKTGEGEDFKVTEISWVGGNIPPDQRDEFVFSAQAPADEGNLVWKAYQTYGNGEVVAWDADPMTVEENPKADGHGTLKPYSETEVTNDLKASDTQTVTPAPDKMSLVLSLIALTIASTALILQLRRK